MHDHGTAIKANQEIRVYWATITNFALYIYLSGLAFVVVL
jgi:hypothetical protein